jgi:hypothetical protein
VGGAFNGPGGWGPGAPGVFSGVGGGWREGGELWRHPLDARPKRPFGRSLKDRLTQQLAGVATVRFVSRGASVVVGEHGGSAPGHVLHGRVVMTLGLIRGDATRIRVGASRWRNGLDGAWQTYALTRVSGHWAVTGTVGPVAIS